MNDDDLMVRTAEGDEGAFRALVEKWERPVFAFLDRMLGSREEAQDLGQETFLRVYRQAKRYRPEGRFKSWLFRIAGNLARSRLRRNKILRWTPFEPGLHDRDSGSEAPDRALERGERERAVRDAIGKLPERQRRALLLLRFEGLRYREIAEAMDVTAAAVDSLIQRAMAGLKKELAGKAGER